MQRPKPCRLKLHILSPIHIGAGQELDPFSYTIRDNTLLMFDLLKWMDSYEKKEELYSQIDTDDYIALRAYIAENFEDENAVMGSITVKSPEVMKRYHKAVKDRQSENQALVHFMTRNDITREPYIPGSSIKGAIRTAVANQFVRTVGVTRQDKKPNKNPDYNKKIFGKNLLKNPMKHLKIADVSLAGIGSYIYEAKEHSAKPDKTPKGGFEASGSLCETDSPVVLSMHAAFAPLKFQEMSKIVDLQGLIDCLYEFYMPKYIEEYNKFYSGHKDIQEAIAPMSMAAVSLKTNESLIRIGHFSHVECVTFDHIRDPWTRRDKNGKLLPYGKTRTLANGIYPFGWAKLECSDLPANPRPKQNWPFSVDEVTKHTAAKAEARKKAEADKILMEKRKQEAEEKKIAEEKRKAELEAMAPEDRMIAEIDEPGVPENRVVEIFGEIDSFPDDKKQILAQSLKNYWQDEDKWTKKKCSKKQWDKVQKIKMILGEI